MNNTTTKRTTVTAIVALFLAATLVVGIGTLATTTSTAFAYQGKNKGSQDNGGRKECKNKGSASGFDTAVDQECENLICTHPGNNATCTEGAISTPTSTSTPMPQPTTGTLLVNKICICNPLDSFPIQITGNNPPSTFILTPGSSQLVTLGTGAFSVTETDTTNAFFTTFSGNCMQTFPFSKEATGTISAGQHLSCTITNEPNR